eukprot:TRINITY_DN14089_c0_g1_i1.p1 TRINITY_DN14089_c0_g1~~TRINITY_DN14089_c0_g1_i1.p1  ORF type:complete len:1000 (+),score=183.15 TRINITY_DN14089_c0_g1_i1:89-3088(+)
MVSAGGGPVEVCLEGLPQVRALLRAHSEEELRLATASAYGFRSPGAGEFELLERAEAQGDGACRRLQVRALTRPQLVEVACIEGLFRDLPLFGEEVVYSELARVTGIPLLRIHRVVAPSCGAAVAQWFQAFREELEGVSSVRDLELRGSAWQRAWRGLQTRIEAVFPKLVEHLPEELRMPAPCFGGEEDSVDGAVASCCRFFSRVLDEVRLRVLPLRSRRIIANGTYSSEPSHLWPGFKRLLRVCWDAEKTSRQSERFDDQASRVFLAVLDGEEGNAGSLAASPAQDSRCSGMTGHALYFEAAKFFGARHVQVRTRSGANVTFERPHQPLLGQLPGSTDGVCVDLVASAHQPLPGSFGHLYREVLGILGPRHFTLDQSYRLQISGSQPDALTTTQGSAIVATIIVIPMNFLEGKQMYLFRSPRYRQCKAALRTFDEFKEMLGALVQVYGLLANQMSPNTAERLRQTCTEGAPGQTPLAQYHQGRAAKLSQAWNFMHGCQQASHSAIGLIGGLRTAAPHEVPGLQGQWWVPEDFSDHTSMFHAQDALHEHYDNLRMLNMFGGSSSDAVNPEMKRIFDIHGLDAGVETPMMPYWLPGSPAAGANGYGANYFTGLDPWADAWSIAVGGFVGLLFGLAEGVYSKVSEQRRCGEADPGALILQKMARRGSVGIGVSALFSVFGRFLRLSLPDSRYASISKKSIPASQAMVFVGTCAWAVCSHRQYVQPSVVRRIWSQDLNLAERQAAGIILTSGLACSSSVAGFFLGSHLCPSLGSLAGPAGAFAGSLMPFVITLFIAGLDWFHDRTRRRQMKAAALQTLGLPEPHELGIEVFRPMLAARYKLLACYLHPDKNDKGRCDTTMVFSQVRLAKEILEQELQDYQSCPRNRLKRLFEQMIALCGYRRDRFVSEHPSGVIMNILEDGPVEDLDPGFDEHRAELESITTVESRSMTPSPSPTGSPRSVQREEGSQSQESKPWVIVPGSSAARSQEGAPGVRTEPAATCS